MPTAYFALRLHDAGALPPDLERRLAAVLPFEPDRSHHVQRGASHLFAWFKDAHLQPGSAWCDGDVGAAAVAGYGLDPEGGPLDAAAAACPDDIEAVWRRFHGEWSACCVSPDGALAAASSAPGTEHVYYTEQPTFTAISNRARLVWAGMRALGKQPEVDIETLAGLLTTGYLRCTDATAARDVRLLDATCAIEIGPSGRGVQRKVLDPTFFLPRDEAPGWRVMADALRANVRWLLRASAPLVAAITGGKDSRLVLAALHAEGVDRRARFYLGVPQEHADFLVARRIAERFDLSFERRDPPSPPDLVSAIRRHVAFTEGALNAWDLKARDRYIAQIGVHGLFGELYRGRRGAVPGDLRVAGRTMLRSIDRGAIVRPEIRRAEEARMHRWLAELVERGVAPDRLRDVFYLRQRLHRWAGQAKLHDGLMGLQVNPLYHPVLLQGYGALQGVDRVGERVHFELMRVLCEELVSLPFACDRWDPAMIQRSTAPNTPSSTSVDHLRPILGTGWQTHALRAGWRSVRGAITGALDRLDGIVIPARVDALLDVAELALEVPVSLPRKARVALRHPRLVRDAHRDPQVIVHQILGLLTLAVFPDELAADPPARVQLT